MRDDFIKAAKKVVPDPYILVNIVSLRVKQLRHGSRALVESLESLALEDVALREIAEGKISYELGPEEMGGSGITFAGARARPTTPKAPKAPKADERRKELVAR